jgi:hypothetical protein
MYLPVILALGALTLGNLKSYHKKKILRVDMITVIVLLTGVVSLYSNSNYMNSINPGMNALNGFERQAKLVADSFGLIPSDVVNQRQNVRDEYLNGFDILKNETDSGISAPEMFMPALTSLGFGSIDYFPIGVGYNRIVVVPFTNSNFNEVEISIYGLVPEGNRLLLSNEIVSNLRKSYVLLAERSGSFGNFAVYRKL